MEESAIAASPGKGRKKLRDPSKWKKNQEKRLR